MLARYARLVVSRPGLVLGASLVVTVLLALQARHVTLSFDPESAFPPNDPAVQIDRTIRAEFGGRRFVVIAVVPREGDAWQPEVLRAVRDLTLAVREVPDVMPQNLVSLASPNVRRVEVTDGGGIREDYLMREVPETPEGIARLRDTVRGNPLLRGGVVTEDERAALVLADFWPAAEHGAIARNLALVLDRFRSPAYDLHVTGEPVISAAQRDYIATVPLYMGAAIAVMMVVLLVSFRTWQGMLLPLLTGVLSALWGLGLMGMTGVALGIWNQSVPTLVVIVAAGHSAQMLKRYYEELDAGRDNRHAVIESLVRMAPVMLAAGATAALGFASLAVLGVPGMADLGFSAAYGIGSAMVLELSFMPALRARMRPRGGRAHGAFGERGLRLLGDWLLSRRGPAVILGAAALVIVVAAAGVPRIRPGGSTREYLPAGHAVTHDLEAIRSHFPGTVSMTILFDGPPGAATAPETLAGIARLARALRTDPNVARTASLVDLVEELHAVFGPEGTWTLPADRALLAQLLFLGRGPAFERFVDRGDRRTVLWAYLRSDEPVEVERVLALARREAAALELPAGMTVQVAGGVGPMLVALEATVTRGKVLNIAALLGVIYVLSSLVLRSPVAGVFVVLPLVLAVAVSFGVVAWTGIRFDVVSASVLAIGVGIGADYAIYCLYRLREELRRGLPLAAALRRMLDTSGRATLFVAVSIALGFTVFAPSAYLAFRLSGLLTPVGMLASCLAALSVMPAALLVVRPAFLFGRRPACPAPAAAPEAVQRSA